MLAIGRRRPAEGELNIFNWGNYTSPEMIKKFEETYKVKVTVTDYDSNDTALAKIRAGGHGFDIVVPSANFMPIWISEGLLLERGPTRWKISRMWIRSGLMCHSIQAAIIRCRGSGARRASRSIKSVYSGDLEHLGHLSSTRRQNSWARSMSFRKWATSCMLAIMYMGGEPCTGDKERSEEGARQAGRGQAQMDLDGLSAMSRRLCQGRFIRRRQLERLRHSAPACRTTDRLWLSKGRLSWSGWTMSPFSRTRRMSRTPSSSRTSSWIRKMPR